MGAETRAPARWPARTLLSIAASSVATRRECARLGAAFLRCHPEEAGLPELARGLELPDSFRGEDQIVEYLRGLRQTVISDYEDGRLVCIEGLFLSRTEARFCAAIALWSRPARARARVRPDPA